jgi:hypothetical protein
MGSTLLIAQRTTWQECLKTISPSAQRLSASLESSLRSSSTRRKTPCCAQRLSASLESSPGCQSRRQPLLSSAQRLSASLESSRYRGRQPSRGATCSTPFGIIGIFTRARIRRNTPYWQSAQRLSASLESSLADWRSRLTRPRHMCSTPFGIIGIFTRNLPARFHHMRFVLNAFRHHWNLHRAANRKDWPPHIAGAQRLSASLESSPRSLRRAPPCRPSAQRLSASLESSRRAEPSF